MDKLLTTNTPLGKLYHVPITRDFEQMLISAERYAVGRRTYIVGTTTEYIIKLLPYLSDWCLCILYTDLEMEFELCNRMSRTIGDHCDHQHWVQFFLAVRNEQESRKKVKDG